MTCEEDLLGFQSQESDSTRSAKCTCDRVAQQITARGGGSSACPQGC